MSNPYDKPRFTLGELKPQFPPCVSCGRTDYPVEYGPECNNLPMGSVVYFDDGSEVWICRRCSRDSAAIQRLEDASAPKPPEPESGIDHDLIRKTIQRLSMVEMARGYLRYMAVRRWNHRETGISSERFDERTDRRVMEDARRAGELNVTTETP